MFIDENSLKISIDGGTTYTNMSSYITGVKYEYNKMWGDDTGRNLKGTFSGTFVGIFPKIILTFKPLTKDELNTIAPILDSKTQKIQYYDPNKNATITINTYAGDWGHSQINVGQTQGFDCSFIIREKRA